MSADIAPLIRVNPGGRVSAAALSTGFDYLATGASNGDVQVWALPAGTEVAQARDEAAVTAVAFLDDPLRLVTANLAGTVRVWELPAVDAGRDWFDVPKLGQVTSFVPTRIREGLSAPAVWGLSVSSQRAWVAVATHDDEQGLWDVLAEEPRISAIVPHGLTWAVAFSSDGRYLITGSGDRTARVWRVPAEADDHAVARCEEALPDPLPHDAAVRAVAFSPDRRYIATAADDGTARVWERKAIVTHIEHPGLSDIALGGSEPALVATAGEDGKAIVREIDGGRVIITVNEQNAINAVVLSADAHLLVTAGDDGVAAVYDTVRGRRLDPELATSPEFADPRDLRRGSAYLFNDTIVQQVNLALSSRRPLLVTGPRGTGKSTLASAVAGELGCEYLAFAMTERTEARDLLGFFDHDLRAASKPVVVLLDNLDNASAEVRDSLLPVVESDFEAMLLVVLAAEDERSLPDDLVRGCIRLALGPAGPERLADIARARGLAREPRHAGDLADLAARLADDAAATGLSPPTTGEYLDIARISLKLGLEPGTPEWTRVTGLAIRIALETRSQGLGTPATGEYVDLLQTAREQKIEPDTPRWAGLLPDSRPATVRRLQVFLCHSSDDKPAIRKLYTQLDEDGYKPWLDKEDLLPGQAWDAEIRKAVRASDTVLVCMSAASIGKRGFLQKELRYAFDVADEQPPGTIFLIPVRLEECDVPERLALLEWVDLFAPDGYERLTRSLREAAQRLAI